MDYKREITLMAPQCIKVPNRVVDMNSRTRLACYPRGSFYPLSPDRNHSESGDH
jgi:hypothetical protein